MTNYRLEEFQTWLNEERNQGLKISSGISWEKAIDAWRAFETFDEVCRRFRNLAEAKKDWFFLCFHI